MAGNLSPEVLDLIAARFRVLAEPARLKILNQLMAGEATVTELTEERYINTVKDVACFNRDFSGVDDEKQKALSSIYFHHKTNPTAVAGFGRKINTGDIAEAQRLGEVLATAIERCAAP